MDVVGHAIEAEAVAAGLERDVWMLGRGDRGSGKLVRPGVKWFRPIGAFESAAGGVLPLGLGGQAEVRVPICSDSHSQ